MLVLRRGKLLRNNGAAVRNSRRAWVTVPFLTVVAGAALSVSFAQLPVATILGSVKDSSGAVIPETKLTAKNVETGQTRTVISEADGSYRISALPVGNYEVRAEHLGFQTEVRSGLILTVGQEALVNITLDLGAVQQTVAVTAEAPLVNTTSGSLGGLVSEQKVADLPLNGRNYTSLTLLQTGVQQVNLNRGGPTGGPQTSGVWFSSNGAPPRSNNFLLDGAIMQTSNDSGSSGVSQLSLGIDGIREWRVVTNSFSAEYGMTMGSQVVIVSKGGTNQFHGSAFEYLRNSALDARNFYDYTTNATPFRLPAFRRNNFGGSFGGPIKKDKTFFYGVFEALRERLGVTTISSTIPLASRASTSISPVIQPFLPLFPVPNLPSNEFTFPYTQPTDENYGQMRVDHTISSSDNMFGRYTIDDAQQVLTEAFPEFKEFRNSRFQYATLAENHIFSPTLLNTARFSLSRTVVVATTPSGISGPQFSFVPGQETGNISIGGVAAWGGGATDPSVSKQNIFTLSDDLFYTRGRHSLKFGSLVNHYQFYKETGSLSRGQLSFASVTTFLAAEPTSISAVTPGSILDRTYHYDTLGFYAQDDVRMSSHLTLNLGLRYEINTTWHEEQGHGSELRNVLEDAAFTVGDPFKNPSLKNFGPRLGFAWDVMGNGKTAVRGGGGLMYDISNLAAALGANETAEPPFSSSSTILTPPPIASLPLLFPASAAGKSVRVLDYNIRQTHALVYNLTVEQQLPSRMALTVSYAGSRGFNIPQLTDGNPTVPTILPNGQPFWTGTEPRINPNWTSIAYNTASGDSLYNSMQVGLVKTLSQGLQFQSSFTWSKLMDDTQVQNAGDTANASDPMDPARPGLDWAPADFDSTLNWRFNAIYHVPDLVSSRGVVAKLVNGWWTTGILTLQSGFPVDPRVQANISRDLESDRPDLVAGRDTGNISSGTTAGCPGVAAGQQLGTPNLYFDPCAFVLQQPGFLGNAGRNIIRGPGTADLDFSLVKDTAIRALGESGKIEFRAEVFNVLNHPNFGNPSNTIFAGTGPATPLSNAGVITNTGVASRQIQFALKVLF